MKYRQTSRRLSMAPTNTADCDSRLGRRDEIRSRAFSMRVLFPCTGQRRCGSPVGLSCFKILIISFLARLLPLTRLISTVKSAAVAQFAAHKYHFGEQLDFGFIIRQQQDRERAQYRARSMPVAVVAAFIKARPPRRQSPLPPAASAAQQRCSA